MPESRFTPEQMQAKALAVLEEALIEARRKPVEPSSALRFAIAYLGNDISDRSPFDAFWKAVTGAGDKGINPTLVHQLRGSNATGPLVSIYQALGYRRGA